MAQNIAVMTGASGGIGEASIRRAAAERLHVVAAARRVQRLDALVAVACDVTDDDTVEHPAEVVAGSGGTPSR